MTEPNYQKPPLRSEIDEFLAELKETVYTIIKVMFGIALCVGAYKLSTSEIGNQVLTYVKGHIKVIAITGALNFISYIGLHIALTNRYLIYKRYRHGYFSDMMWCFIGFIATQIFNILIYIHMDGLIPIIAVELIAMLCVGLSTRKFKKERAPLDRPLTRKENKLRDALIYETTIYCRAELYRDSWPCNSLRTIHKHARAFARVGYLMDMHPELLETVDDIDTLYGDELGTLEVGRHINVEDPRYKAYYERAHDRLQMEEWIFTPSLESLFD